MRKSNWIAILTAVFVLSVPVSAEGPDLTADEKPSSPEILIQAHAGASAIAPENTRAAFRTAKEAGADGLETDVRMTKDHHLVIRHDERIDSTSNGHGSISEMTLEELRKYDYGSWFGPEYEGESILTLEECLEEAQKLDFDVLNLEMKPVFENSTEFVRLTADTIRASDFTGHVMVSSFDKGLLKELNEYAPEIPTAVLAIPNLSAISMFNLSDYFPADKCLKDYTREDVAGVPDVIALIMRGFGVKGDTDEDVVLEVLRGVAAVVPEYATWSEAEEAILEQADLISFVDSLDFRVDYLNCHYNSITGYLVGEMHKRGIEVNVWTPDSRWDLEKTIYFKPDGIITNAPELSLELMNRAETAG